MFLCEHVSPIDQSAYDLKLKAPAEETKILFMSGQRFGETGSFDACESFFFPRSDTPVRMHSAPVFVFVNVLRFR